MNRETRTLLIVDGSASHLFYLGSMLRRLELSPRQTIRIEMAFKGYTLSGNTDIP